MGSIMDSRYWTCKSCFRVFDWEKNEPQNHDSKACAASQARKTTRVPERTPLEQLKYKRGTK